MFINRAAVKKYAKERKRRVSRAFLYYLDMKVQGIIDGFIKANSLRTLRP